MVFVLSAFRRVFLYSTVFFHDNTFWPIRPPPNKLINPAKRVIGAFRRILYNFIALFFLEGKRAFYTTTE